MKPRYSFSSRHTRNLDNIKKEKEKYPALTKKVVEISDIILEVLDARFIEETRNKEIEELIKGQNKKMIFILNKADLTNTRKLKKTIKEVYPYVLLSCKKRFGSRELREQIKIQAKKIDIPFSGDRITVGVIGYPNTGKSSIINFLIGKSSAGTSPSAGFTKGIQKIKLTPEIVLIDTPGVIPESQYSHEQKELITKHAKLNARDYSKVSNPEHIVHELLKDYQDIIEKHYKIKTSGDVETLLDKLGNQKRFLRKGGIIDEDRTARFVLKEWQEGKIRV